MIPLTHHCEYFSFYNLSPLHSPHSYIISFSLSQSLFLVHPVLLSALHPLDKCCAACFFFFFTSISAIIAFHPAEYRDGNNLTLILRANTILL